MWILVVHLTYSTHLRNLRHCKSYISVIYNLAVPIEHHTICNITKAGPLNSNATIEAKPFCCGLKRLP